MYFLGKNYRDAVDEPQQRSGFLIFLFRASYATLFFVVIPCCLILWCRHANYQFKAPLPTVRIGVGLLAAGAILYLFSLATFLIYTKKLPINIDPPERAVNAGPYYFLSDPIYAGFCTLAFGAAAVAESAFGFWFVCPTIVLLCAALVLGYENQHRPTRRSCPAIFDWPSDGLIISDLNGALSTLFHTSFISLVVVSVVDLIGSTHSVLPFLFLIVPIINTFSLALSRRAVSSIDLRRFVITQYVGSLVVSLVVYGLTDVTAMAAIPAGLSVGALLRVAQPTRSGDIRMGALVSTVIFIVVTAIAVPELRISVISIAAFSAIIGYTLPPLHKAFLDLSRYIANSWSSRAGPANLHRAIGGVSA